MPSMPPTVRPVLRAMQGLALLGLLAALAPARAERTPPARTNYKQALKYSKANLDPLSYSTNVVPGWIGKSDWFWYAYRTSKGTRYWRVDPGQKAKKLLFDHEKLASQLVELGRKPVDADALPLSRGRISDDGGTFSFVAGDFQYEYDLKAEKLVSKGKAPPAPAGFGDFQGFRRRRGAEDEPQVKTQQEKDKEEKDKQDTDRTRRRGFGGFGIGAGATRALAPDRKGVLFVKDKNLYLGEQGKDKEAVQLTRDGATDYTFALEANRGNFGGLGRGRGGRGAPMAAAPAVQRSNWAKDSNHFYAVRLDARNIKELFVIDSLHNPRPKLEQYKYPMPGEDGVRKSELYIGTRASKALTRVPRKWRDETYSNLHWGRPSGELRFIREDRLKRNLELCALDVGSGKCRALLSEGFDNAQLDPSPIRYMPRYLENSDEMICWSERSGWGHFYLYDTQGKLKNAITSGSWRASQVVALDEKNRLLYVRGNGREKGENVYHEHLYSVRLDGSGLTLLDPGNANHTSTLSPTRQFVVDNGSRVDQGPETVLRDAAGIKVMDLEKCDLSRLKEYGWRLPETFVVKAADGVTDLYGNLWKPFDFDPKKKYPIIAHVYPGPQTEGVTHTFSVAGQGNMQMAQLGFIVIQVGHRGGAPTRSKAYGSYGYFNLRDYGLADKKTAIEQLAARHAWIDLKNVGIYGHSGGGFMSAAALLQKPYNEFFKAAVASAGNHDNNVYNYTWAERYHGMREVAAKAEVKDRTKGPDTTPAAPPARAKKATSSPPSTAPAAPPATKFVIKVPTNAELAANLKGRLLLVHGEIDNNVHPANTMRLVDALIKANKRFDMLIIPGKRHGFGDAQPYFTRRMWEFFAENLRGDRRGGADLEDERE